MISFSKFFQLLLVAGMLLFSAAVYANVDCNQAVPYVSEDVYVGGDEVIYQEKLYRAKWWTTKQEPTAGDPWEFLGSCVALPNFTFSSPAYPGEVYMMGQEIPLEISVNYPGDYVSKVVFRDDSGNVIGEVTRGPYRVNWVAPFPGRHYLAATIYLENGNIDSVTTNVVVEKGSTINQCEGVPKWDDLNNSTVVIVPFLVQHNGRLYEAKWWMQDPKSEEPGKSSWGVWKDLGPCLVQAEPAAQTEAAVVTADTANAEWGAPQNQCLGVPEWSMVPPGVFVSKVQHYGRLYQLRWWLTDVSSVEPGLDYWGVWKDLGPCEL